MSGEEFFGDWYKVINFDQLMGVLSTVEEEMNRKIAICPTYDLVFKAFTECPYSNLSVIILGQDPYPQKGIATGLAFANKADTPPEKYSPSLKKIVEAFNTYYTDLPSFKFSPDLTYLANQGVLLLNTSLTVKEGEPMSHQHIWRNYMENLLYSICMDKPGIIVVTMGKAAQYFEAFLPNANIIECPHPAYCTRIGTSMPNFISEVDNLLTQQGKPTLYWL